MKTHNSTAVRERGTITSAFPVVSGRVEEVKAVMGRINLEEVGRLAGVSRSTVSRVVNGSPNVSREARTKVEAVIAETSYRPHAAARSLASNRTGVIGLVIPGAADALFDDPYFGRLVLGITGSANALRLNVALFLFSDESGAHVKPQVANTGLLDGVIVTATKMGEPLFGLLRSAGMPHVVVGRPDDPGVAYSVDADNFGGSRSVAHHLAELGCQRPAMISAPSDSSAGVDRRNGFLQGLTDVGLTLDGREAPGEWSEDSGRQAMNALIDHRPDAVFVGSDRMAIGALSALRDAGVACPEEVAVVAFDGLLPPDQLTPQLSSVAQPVGEVGQRAAAMLKAVIDGSQREPLHEVLPTELLIRASSRGFSPAPRKR